MPPCPAAPASAPAAGRWAGRLAALVAALAGGGCIAEADPTPDGPAVEVFVRARPAGAVEREAAVAIGGCVAGGTAGVTSRYAEAEPDVRLQAIEFDYDVDRAAELALPADPDDLDLDLGAIPRFFVLRGITSSALAIGDVHARVPAGLYGAWYRQTSRLAFPAGLYARTASGAEVELGEVTIVDWGFAVGLGLAPSCPPRPPPPPELAR